jgi:hypothetical protein
VQQFLYICDDNTLEIEVDDALFLHRCCKDIFLKALCEDDILEVKIWKILECLKALSRHSSWDLTTYPSSFILKLCIFNPWSSDLIFLLADTVSIANSLYFDSKDSVVNLCCILGLTREQLLQWQLHEWINFAIEESDEGFVHESGIRAREMLYNLVRCSNSSPFLLNSRLHLEVMQEYYFFENCRDRIYEELEMLNSDLNRVQELNQNLKEKMASFRLYQLNARKMSRVQLPKSREISYVKAIQDNILLNDHSRNGLVFSLKFIF